MLLVSAAIGLVALLAVAGTVVVVRRRRAPRAPSLSLSTRHAPAGVSHLATRVSDLSDLGFHLHPGATQRRSLGNLLGSSSGASR